MVKIMHYLDLTISDLRGYRLFVHISGVFNAFILTKRANFEKCVTPTILYRNRQCDFGQLFYFFH